MTRCGSNARAMWMAALTAIAMFAFETTAHAQYGRMREEGLSGEDLDIIEDASKPLYTQAAVQPGATSSWKSEKSGNSGTIRIVEVYQYQGMPCRKIEHIITIKDKKDPRQYVVDRCQVAGGEWKLRF